jgi:hypothetical protein
MERDLMMTASLEQITSALIRRFKEHVAVAMQALTSDKFTLVDIRAGKNLRGFAQSMFRHAKAQEMTSEFKQLMVVWNGLDLPLRMQIAMPTSASTVRRFLEELYAKSPFSQKWLLATVTVNASTGFRND